MPDEPEPGTEPATGTTDLVSFDDFVKVKLRIGKVIVAEDHPNADKLLVLTVDLGAEKRQICAGLKGHYTPEELLGKNLVIVANLAPRMMRGIQSQGMLLAASSPDKSSVIVITADSDIEPGSAVS